jgi:hypothetical protein
VLKSRDIPGLFPYTIPLRIKSTFSSHKNSSFAALIRFAGRPGKE